MTTPKKDGWYLAFDMEWDRTLYKNGRWIAQTKTRHVGQMTDVMIRDDVTEHVTAWIELPAKPDNGE